MSHGRSLPTWPTLRPAFGRMHAGAFFFLSLFHTTPPTTNTTTTTSTRTDERLGKHLVQLGGRERPGVLAGLVKRMQGRLQVPKDLDDVALAFSGKGLLGPTQRLDLHS